MLTPLANGSLAATLPLYTKLHYDISNRCVLAQADGSFALPRYAIAGLCPVFQQNSFYTALAVGGLAIPPGAQKQLSMLGRTQAVQLNIGGLGLQCLTFLDKDSPAVFQQYNFVNNTAAPLCAAANFGWLFDTALMATAANLPAQAGLAVQAVPGGFLHSLPSAQHYTLACNLPLTLKEIEGSGLHYSWQLCLAPGASQSVCLAYCLHGTQQPANPQATAQQLLAGFAAALKAAQGHQQWLQQNLCKGSPLQRALYAAALNCAESAYKQVGDFCGFYAGVNYQAPPRTYYRDGYFTALPLLAHCPALVRRQLLTLALGINPNGSCPSAVISANAVFWPGHIDSPAFFIMLLHDYIAATGDIAVLKEQAAGKTLLAHATALAGGLLAAADNTHLIPRAPGNRHDWADNVYREGYVTYIQALFHRAMQCTAGLLNAAGLPGQGKYTKAAALIKTAVNTLLWNEEKGWYNNYVSAQCVEDNLSIDTVLCSLFGLAGKARSRRLLLNMQQYLETAENHAQPFGDWGTMCCWPPYKYPAHLVEKSAYPFVYHNASDWPYLSSLYAFAKAMHGLPFEYPLTRWFTYCLQQGWATPVEYYSPVAGCGGLLQAWGGMAAFTLRFAGQGSFPFQLEGTG